ncbi:hypothetical protein SARC_10438 [Sphaeroforma arctica JP610]|uniref:DRBM domain-containing protein n=1 Tax=Sphaeroforma arctica JP610 TaxID=667725 RepID=A0A0L0FM54_9EUKA|nr:hypothetical protein SARC_10438 [Sphaeroforma arctica JP610]KNC77093.1 hypothetical protein SARC_10438 [Sphaeroforma arctica JP610]|eukprot:XP_014150995.1 hypothetical protein SARC_10438 [Sphaeroforma arctica JP610]
MVRTKKTARRRAVVKEDAPTSAKDANAADNRDEVVATESKIASNGVSQVGVQAPTEIDPSDAVEATGEGHAAEMNTATVDGVNENPVKKRGKKSAADKLVEGSQGNQGIHSNTTVEQLLANAPEGAAVSGETAVNELVKGSEGEGLVGNSANSKSQITKGAKKTEEPKTQPKNVSKNTMAAEAQIKIPKKANAHASKAEKAKARKEAAIQRKNGGIDGSELKLLLDEHDYQAVLTALKAKHNWGAMAVDEFARSLPYKRTVTVYNADVHIGGKTYHGHFYSNAAQARREACKGVYLLLRSSVIASVPKEHKTTELTMERPMAAYTTFPPALTRRAVEAPALTVTSSSAAKAAKPTKPGDRPEISIDHKRYIMQFSDRYKIKPITMEVVVLTEAKGGNEFQGKIELPGWFNITGPVCASKKAAATAVNVIAAETLRARVVAEDHPYKEVETPIVINGLQIPSSAGTKRTREVTDDTGEPATKKKRIILPSERAAPYTDENGVLTMPPVVTVKADNYKSALVTISEGMKWGKVTYAEEVSGYQHSPLYRSIVTIKGLQTKSYTGPWVHQKKLSQRAASKRAFVEMAVKRFKPHTKIPDNQTIKVRVVTDKGVEEVINKKFRSELDVSDKKNMKALGVTKNTRPGIIESGKNTAKTRGLPRTGGNSSRVKNGAGRSGQYTNGVYQSLRSGQKGSPLVDGSGQAQAQAQWYDYNNQAAWGQPQMDMNSVPPGGAPINGVSPQQMNGISFTQGHSAYMNEGSYAPRSNSATYYNNDPYQAYQQPQQQSQTPSYTQQTSYSQSYGAPGMSSTSSTSQANKASTDTAQSNYSQAQGYSDYPAPGTTSRRY